MVISLHDPDLFEENKIPFRAPPPFGVTASEWQTNPPAVNCYTFVHGTSFQAGAEILREGLLRPTALPKGTRAAASVVYGAATPGDISDYTVQTATANSSSDRKVAMILSCYVHWPPRRHVQPNGRGTCVPQTRHFAQQRPLGCPRGPPSCAGSDNGGSQPMTIACKQNNAPTDLLHCTSKLRKVHSIDCLSFTLVVLCFAGPWIQTKSRLGTQAWPFLSNEASIIQQVLPLETLRYQQQTPHNLRPTKTSLQRSRRRVRQANGRTRPRNAGSTEDRLQPTRAAHLAAHLPSAHIDQDHHIQTPQLHTSIPTHQASSTTTSARTGEVPRSRACAKMLVRAGYRCPCHFLRECPSVLFLQPVTLLFHTTTDAD